LWRGSPSSCGSAPATAMKRGGSSQRRRFHGFASHRAPHCPMNIATHGLSYPDRGA
jgi:hypothetical protein